MRKNVLISTTRQWNPGDEFIMQGALHALEYTYGDIWNPILFNRNPDIRGGSRWRNRTRTSAYTYIWDQKVFKGKGILQELFGIGHFDNSFKDDMDSGNIDLALFAGSPEWYGNRLIPMYQTIEKSDVPTVFLGLGAGDSSAFSDSIPAVDRVLRKAKLITTRDHSTEQLLQEYGAQYVPCPALLAAPSNRLVKKVNRIGLIYATDHTVNGNNVSKEMHAYIVTLYRKLLERYPAGISCHYIDELDQAKQEFPHAEIFYSYDSKEYADIYDHFDLVVGGRVHGIGMSASLGIPGIMIKHDSRSSTTDGFLAPSFQVDTSVNLVTEQIEKMSDGITELSEKLIAHKKNVLEQYKMLFLKRNLLL